MKKSKFDLRLWSILLLIVMSLTACNKELATNAITEVKLTDREGLFLSIDNSKFFVFNFKVDDSYKWMEVWAEEYQLGEKVKEISLISKGIEENREGLIMVKINDSEKDKDISWTVAIRNEGVIASQKLFLDHANGNGITTTVMGENPYLKDINITEDEVMLLNAGYIKQNASGSGVPLMNFSPEFYHNPDENIYELAIYDVAHLLKIRFYKENPNKFGK